MVSGNSHRHGVGGDSRFMLNNLSAINTSNNQNTYHSLTRAGVKKITFHSMHRTSSPSKGCCTGTSSVASSRQTCTQLKKSYKSLTPGMAQQTSKNPVLLKLQTNQQQRG